jgi:hypothetical protein
VRAISISADRDEIDASTLSNGAVGGEHAILGKRKASGDVEYLASEFDDLDPGAATPTFFGWLMAGTSFLLDVQMGPTGTTQGFRAWCKLPGIGRDGMSKGADLIGRKLKWHCSNDGPTKDAWFSTTEAFT